MKAKTAKSDRIEVRVSNDIKVLIERAAREKGLSVSAFATAILVENAREVIKESSRIILSSRDQEIFLKALDRGPNKALIKAAKKYKSLHEH